MQKPWSGTSASTRLYEYYIETMDASFDEVLPQVIRMYFSYSNTLAGQKKALIYANVIKTAKRPPYIPELPPGDGGFHGKTDPERPHEPQNTPHCTGLF